MKAVFKGNVYNKYNKRYVTQVFEYRGQTYLIEKPLTWNCSSDYNNGGYMSLKNQHERAQKAIDSKLDNPIEEIKPYTGEVEKALDELYKFWET